MAVFAWGDVTDLIWAGQAFGMRWKCWSSKPLGSGCGQLVPIIPGGAAVPI